MRGRGALSLVGATAGALLLVGTSRLAWNVHEVVPGPGLHLTETETTLEFNLNLSLDMCEPGPEGEPVSLFMDLSAGFEIIDSIGSDTGESPSVSVTLYPSDGSTAESDVAELQGGRAGLFLSSHHIQCPAFGVCERSYVVVFEVQEGASVSGWWTVTASAMGPDGSDEEDYRGDIGVTIEER